MIRVPASLVALFAVGSCASSSGPDIGRAGSVCGSRDIQGMVIAEIDGPGACGIARPVQLASVSGVTLSQQATVNCDAARALNEWVKKGVKPAVGRTGGGIAELRVISHYACRNRNSRRDARLSEHAKGNAIDIAGFKLKNGSEISVLDDWGKGSYGKILRDIHKSACGPFGTVLGPGADRYHRNHIHSDTVRYSNKTYCR